MTTKRQRYACVCDNHHWAGAEPCSTPRHEVEETSMNCIRCPAERSREGYVSGRRDGGRERAFDVEGVGAKDHDGEVEGRMCCVTSTAWGGVGEGEGRVDWMTGRFILLMTYDRDVSGLIRSVVCSHQGNTPPPACCCVGPAHHTSPPPLPHPLSLPRPWLTAKVRHATRHLIKASHKG